MPPQLRPQAQLQRLHGLVQGFGPKGGSIGAGQRRRRSKKRDRIHRRSNGAPRIRGRLNEVAESIPAAPGPKKLSTHVPDSWTKPGFSSPAGHLLPLHFRAVESVAGVKAIGQRDPFRSFSPRHARAATKRLSACCGLRCAGETPRRTRRRWE
ncbi:hypothetical protein GCM10027048_13250 [Hymenobacter coalescens]